MPTSSEARSAKRIVTNLIDNLLCAMFGAALGLACIVQYFL